MWVPGAVIVKRQRSRNPVPVSVSVSVPDQTAFGRG